MMPIAVWDYFFSFPFFLISFLPVVDIGIQTEEI